jgi:cyclohexanecarboxylate-CoA ligase
MQYDASGLQVRLNDDLVRRRVAAGEWENRTLAELARERCAATPERVMVIEGDARLTVRQILDRSQQLAAALVAAGLEPGDVIGMQMPNWAETTLIYLAATLAGLIINPVLPILRDSEVKFMLADSRCRLMFIPREFRHFDYVEMMKRLAPDLPLLKKVVVLRGEAQPFEAWERFAAFPGVQPRLPAVDPNAVKVMMYTSGTTGRPKGVLHTHNTLQAETRSYREHWGLDGRDVIFMASPVSHVTGCVFAFETPWATGASVVLQDKWNAAEAIDLFRAHGVTMTASSTPFLRELFEVAKSRNERLPAFKRFVCGGMPVPPRLVHDAQQWLSGSVIGRCYGSSELPSVTLAIIDRRQNELGAETDGIVDPRVSVKIVDAASGAPVGVGSEGEILAKGPELFVGYGRAEDNENAFDEEGYFRTGDLGKLTQENCLVITGRKKDLIIRGGENISPTEIESVLQQHPAIAEVAIIAMPHERLGETVGCFVVLAAGAGLDQAEVARFLTEKGLARQKIPERVEAVEAMPRNIQGKLLKNVLRERMRALCAPAASPSFAR